MSESSRERQSPRSEIDISTPGSAPGLGWRGGALIYGSVFTVALSMLYFQISFWWILVVIVSGAVLAVAGHSAWILIVRRGAFTWGSLMLTPAKLLARGDVAGAEAACARALARARRFPADDHRRGMMLCELAMFIKHQGRYPEALGLFEEAVDILNQHRATQPIDYFVGLNNYAICFIHLHDYAAAQRILEQAIDLTLAVKKRDEGIIATAPVKQVQMIQFVLHLNLAFLLIEMGELAEAESQLAAADSLLPLLSKQMRAMYGSHHASLSALWAYEAGRFADAEAEIARAPDPSYSGLLRIRANLQRVRGNSVEAERLLRQLLEWESKRGTLHRPELLKTTLDLAESLFDQGRHAEALDAVREACALVADFGLPMDAHWRRMTQRWIEPATQHGKTELVATLHRELARVPAPENQAITILDKFRR